MIRTRTAILAVVALAAAACDGAAPPTPVATGDDVPPAPANADPQVSDNPELCVLGLTVLSPAGSPGTVTKVEGGGCTVKDNATGLEAVWAEFMLDPTPGTTPAMELVPGAPVPGMYLCRGGAAGNFRLEFRAGGMPTPTTRDRREPTPLIPPRRMSVSRPARGKASMVAC